MLLTDNAPPEDNNNNKDDDVGVFPPFPDVPTTDDMATHQISWDAHRKKLTLSTAAEGNPLKRATGAFDDDTNMTKDDTVEKQVGDGVSDSTHQPPPAKKIHWTVWSDDTPLPAALVEKQPRVRPRKNPLPSRVPAAAVAVQNAAQAQPPLDVAPPSSSAGGKGYHGVHWHKPKKRFEAWLRNGGKRLYLGIYDNAEEAAFVYDRAWRDLGNDPLLLNFDDTVPIPQEYLASVADASSKIAALLANREAQKNKTSEINNNLDGAPPPGAAHRGHEVAPAVASSPTIINYNYNVYSGASATFHINHS